MKKIVGSTLELSSKVFFSLDKYQLKIWIENTVFAIQHIGNRKSLLKWFPPRDQTIPLAYSGSFTFHTSYKDGMYGHAGGRGRGGDAVKMLKTICYKNL